jgi:palmitoyltransferase
MRFQVTRQSLLDAILDCVNYGVEITVYLIGPLLICLALAIVCLLTYTFFTVLLPMMQLKHAQSPYRSLIIGLHCTVVVFLLVNILYNYAACVLTKHSGARYDKIVKELASACNLQLPETPEQIQQYRRDFSDRMVIRMRRRQARAVEAATANADSSQQQQQQQPAQNGIKRRTAGTGGGSTPPRQTQSSPPQQQQQPPVRSWMLQGPYEWGFCAHSNQPKPPRSHYDHVTKQLVLNLDHYCPWMFNVSKYMDTGHRLSHASIATCRSQLLRPPRSF